MSKLAAISQHHFLNGQWTSGEGVAMQTTDPATGNTTWSGAQATVAEVDQACKAARAAFYGWATTPLAQRIAICTRFRDLLKEHAEELAQTISLEVGKPLWEARTEVTTMANKIDISIQSYHARTGESMSKIADGDAVLRHRPHGVFGVFGPYNFPGHLPNGHIVPALIAGNTIVFKPSEYAPQTAIKTVQLWEMAGLPKGVLNLINGARDTGVALGQNAILDGILFTGSCQTGTSLHRQFGGQPGKMLALEMGGNNPLVVWDVKNVDAAVHHAIFSAFVSAGQRCTCARRLIVEDNAVGQAFGRSGRQAHHRRIGCRTGSIHGAVSVGADRGKIIASAKRFDRQGRQVLAGNAPSDQRHRVCDGGDCRRHRRQGHPGRGMVRSLVASVPRRRFRRCDDGSQCHHVRLGGGVDLGRCSALAAFHDRSTGRDRQLESSDHRRGQ